jgi:hypothetical protein
VLEHYKKSPQKFSLVVKIEDLGEEGIIYDKVTEMNDVELCEDIKNNNEVLQKSPIK